MLERSHFLHELDRIGPALIERHYQPVIIREEWLDSGQEIVTYGSYTQAYDALAADGSQLYPDETSFPLTHLLVNAGSCHIRYADQGASHAEICSEPKLVFYDRAASQGERSFLEQERDLHELRFAHKIVKEFAFNILGDTLRKTPVLFFLDGSLAVHGEREGDEALAVKIYREELKDFLALCAFKEIHVLGYISFSRSSQLINKLKTVLPKITQASSDRAFLQAVLKPGEGTVAYRALDTDSRVSCDTLEYYFLYLNTGYELVRLECPAFIAQDKKQLSLAVGLCLDQIAKGDGYPVVLTQAHEQAVIKAADKNFFYEMISQKALDWGVPIFLSQKNIAKRGMIL